MFFWLFLILIFGLTPSGKYQSLEKVIKAKRRLGLVFTMLILVRVVCGRLWRVPADHDWYVRMMQDKVTNTPQKGSPQLPLTPGPCDDHVGPFLVGRQADLFPWVTLELFDSTLDLENKSTS